MKNDELGERMKGNYEDRTRFFVPRRTYTIIRLDGKAFHTFTKGYARPYDFELMNMMDGTAIELCEEIQNVKYAYVQSDEISLLLTDFETIHTDAWFGGNVQKMASVSASIATAAFNRILLYNKIKGNGGIAESIMERTPFAYFDSRVFSIPDRNEVFNYFIWRQQDASRNSIQMGAQALYNQKQLHGKNTSELQELMFQKGVNWNDYPVGFKRGRVILKEKIEKFTVPVHGSKYVKSKDGQPAQLPEVQEIERQRWASFEPPIFTQAPGYLRERTPVLANPIESGDKDLLNVK